MITIYDADLYAYFAVFIALSMTAMFLFRVDKVTGKPNRELIQEGDISELKPSLRFLLRSGVNGASLIASFPKYDWVIRFDKYIRAKGSIGISFMMPDDYLNSPKLKLLESFCRDQAISWPVSEAPSDEQTNLGLDCGPDIDKAFRLLRYLAVEVEQVPETARHVYEITGGLRPGELVDDPAKKPVSDNEMAIYEKKTRRALVGGSYFDASKFIILLFAEFVGTLGMIYGLLISVAANIFAWDARWAILDINIVELSFQPKIFDLFFMGLYLLSATQFLSKRYLSLLSSKARKNKKTTSNTTSSTWERTARALLGRRVAKRGILAGLLVVSWLWH